MNYLKYLLLTALIPVFCTACSDHPDAAEIVTRAEHAANAGKYRQALDVCHELTASNDTMATYASQCCRVAVIYALAADNDVDRDESLASASRWFARAYALNADSTRLFVEGLTNERAAAADIAVQLLRNRATDLSDFIDPEDPSAIVDHDIDPDNEYEPR